MKKLFCVLTAVLLFMVTAAGCARAQTDGAAAYYNLGLRWHNYGNYDGAIEAYTRALRINPNHTDAYYNRGMVYQNKVDYDD